MTRRLVYGRPDPKPGNFQPRFGSTPEYQGFVERSDRQGHDWFFDVYLRQAALPELVETREGDRLTLLLDDARQHALPDAGRGAGRRQGRNGGDDRRHRKIDAPAEAHVLVDPSARVLKRSEAVEAAQREPRHGE